MVTKRGDRIEGHGFHCGAAENYFEKVFLEHLLPICCDGQHVRRITSDNQFQTLRVQCQTPERCLTNYWIDIFV